MNVTDPDDAADVAFVYLLIADSFSGQNACFAYLDRTAGRFSLLNDQYTGSAGSVLSGSAMTASNTQCTLNGQDSSWTARETGYAATFNIAFKPGFIGMKTLYVMAADRSGMSSGWVTAGSWNPQNQPPSVTAASPVSGSGSRLQYVVSVTDPQGPTDISQVYLLINESFQGSNACYV